MSRPSTSPNRTWHGVPVVWLCWAIGHTYVAPAKACVRCGETEIAEVWPDDAQPGERVVVKRLKPRKKRRG